MDQWRLVGRKEGEEGTASQRLFVPGYSQRNLVDVGHVLGRIGPRQHRLGGVGDHLGEFVDWRQVGRHIADQTQRHHIVDVV